MAVDGCSVWFKHQLFQLFWHFFTAVNAENLLQIDPDSRLQSPFCSALLLTSHACSELHSVVQGAGPSPASFLHHKLDRLD